ncbi:MAG: chemotaxis protein CheB [Parvibaculaceae bacterium]
MEKEKPRRKGRESERDQGADRILAPLVVGIGASAGGLSAFRTFLERMPCDSGMSFVLVQHLSPDHKSALPELLGRATSMKVIEAADGMPLQANQVFVIPSNATLTIRGGALHVDNRRRRATSAIP